MSETTTTTDETTKARLKVLLGFAAAFLVAGIVSVAFGPDEGTSAWTSLLLALSMCCVLGSFVLNARARTE